MGPGPETLQRDAAALFSFVDSVCACCSEHRESPTYLEPSTRFFAYIQDFGKATKAYLNAFPSAAPRSHRLYQDYRQKLETIRLGWFELHKLIKSAVDADTLNIPYALIQALTKRLNSIHGFENTIFALLHFDEVNYFELPVSAIKDLTGSLQTVVPEAPAFPDGLGLIGIPYSQSSALHLNYLIAHEMGHFAFQESKPKLKERLLPHISTALSQAPGDLYNTLSVDDLDWSKDRLASWAEEIFCDLFAIWLIGPCYTFAYVEIFGLTTILDPSEPRGFLATPESRTFSRSHPADLFRLKQHVLFLKKLGWWSEVSTIRSHYVDVLKSSSKVADTELEVETGEKSIDQESNTLNGFLILAPHIMNLVTEVMKDQLGKKLDTGLTEYQKFSGTISKCLQNAVVPSTVFHNGEHSYPNEVALLNASMKFYLESLENLMKIIEGQRPSLPGHRSKWIGRIEMLIAKAVEDHYLLVGEKGAISDGGSFKRADLGPS